MDELARALGRKYHREPSPENAAFYIRSLERAWGGASDPCLLLDIWASLILGLFDPNGINLAVYDSLLELTLLLFGISARDELDLHVDAADGGFYLGRTESWFDSFLLRLDYKCCHPTTCTNKELHRCEAFIGTGGQCLCPGCYTYDILIPEAGPTEPGRLRTTNVCWHHYQILQSSPRIDFDLDFRNI